MNFPRENTIFLGVGGVEMLLGGGNLFMLSNDHQIRFCAHY